MPCMPARRDLHTGRPNFLHRAWGPLEPFDDSFAEMLKKAGVHTHLATDHYHYFEDGGATYHNRYNTWDFARGQEGDPWIGQVADPKPLESEFPEATRLTGLWRQDAINRQTTGCEEQFPMNLTFRNGIDFIRRNQGSDRWMLQIETFNPHEPFTTLESHRVPYSEHFASYQGRSAEWPPYRPVKESKDVVEHARYEYAALASACDAKLGEVLDVFDELDLWKDTMLIVWTDHGFLLGEHDCWAKCWMPFYQEIAHTPFFIWDPRSPAAAGQRRQALVQPSIDLGPTLLNFFGLEPTQDMTGRDLALAVAEDKPVRDYAIYGLFGGHVNITDGRYTYMRGPVAEGNQPLFEYTLMPTRMRGLFSPEELGRVTELAEPFPFSKGCRTLKVPIPVATAYTASATVRFPTRLYDLKADPQQTQPTIQSDQEKRLCEALVKELRAIHAPAEQFQRLGF